MSSSPETVVLGLWPYATGKQIQYYVQGYKSLYPDASLLLLEYSTSYDRQIGNALNALTTLDEKPSFNPAPKVLLHLFGGCGAAQGCRLLRAYKIRTGRRLTVRAVVMDSVPRLVVPSFRTATRSPQLLLAFLYILPMVVYIRAISTINYWQYDARCRQNRFDLNDQYLLPPEARKCYIFAEKDLMFSWNDSSIKDDDEESVRDDVSVNRTSIDDDKGKWTIDQERYWLGIENVWDGSHLSEIWKSKSLCSRSQSTGEQRVRGFGVKVWDERNELKRMLGMVVSTIPLVIVPGLNMKIRFKVKLNDYSLGLFSSTSSASPEVHFLVDTIEQLQHEDHLRLVLHQQLDVQFHIRPADN
ncbi:hypothetical protein B0A55_07934 [Friedmanniomyces simplex]|uniref:Uncharacterized protein n=1 Tax=Friedmanniomyces simplex TaxID=329884 RepID=A0A4U0XHH4_9PEZI|nr:hypothetical protein B0A55_07934 [Friedmanniomyces simplex]